MLCTILAVDTVELWSDYGARDMAHWMSMRYGISDWKAHRWLHAAHALPSLPLVSEAFANGELGIDKVVELTRFATPEDEEELVAWAIGVPSGRIRERGDELAHRAVEETRGIEETRHLEWRYENEGRSFFLSAELLAADGALVAGAIARLADKIPAMPDQGASVYQRRADALVAMASAQIADDQDPDRATVIVHAQLDTLASGTQNAWIQGGPAIAPETTQRLICDARVQTVLEDKRGNGFKLGRMTREPSNAMIRRLRYRDRGCRFPSCGMKAFTKAHHIE